MSDRVARSVERLRDLFPERPRAGIVLGSGLGGFVETLGDTRHLSTGDVPGFPVSTVAGHAGRVVSAGVEGVPAVLLQGRVHGYEGYALEDLTHGVRVMAELGVDAVLFTNAAGSMHLDLEPGSLMLVRDHISLGFFPLVQDGVTAETEMESERGSGTHVPAGVHHYSDRLRRIAHEAALAVGIRLREGVLVYGRGPTYETRAEVRLYRQIGGDAACMSTVPEVVAARAAGVEAMAISCISNLGTGLSAGRLTHDEVTEVANRVSRDFERLVGETVRRAFA